MEEGVKKMMSLKHKDLSVACVGYGNIAEKHLEVFRELGVNCPASCNRSEEGRGKAEKEGGISRTYSDPVKMVEKEQPDGLLITANVFSLYTLASDLLPFGIPVLLEKPPGISPEQTRELAKMAEKYTTPVMVALNRRFYSVYHKALERLGGREAVTGVSVEWSEDPEKLIQAGHPHEFIPLLNYVNSLHGIDLFTFFAGEVADPIVRGRNLDPTGKKYRWQMSLHGYAENGAWVHFDSNWDVPGRWRLVVDFPDARMVSAPLETGVLLTRKKGTMEIQPSAEDRKFKPGFYGQAEYFLGIIRDGCSVEWPACSLHDAGNAMDAASMLTGACNEL